MTQARASEQTMRILARPTSGPWQQKTLRGLTIPEQDTPSEAGHAGCRRQAICSGMEPGTGRRFWLPWGSRSRALKRSGAAGDRRRLGGIERCCAMSRGLRPVDDHAAAAAACRRVVCVWPASILLYCNVFAINSEQAASSQSKNAEI